MKREIIQTSGVNGVKEKSPQNKDMVYKYYLLSRCQRIQLDDFCFRFVHGQNGFVGKPLLAVHSQNACHGQMHSALAVWSKKSNLFQFGTNQEVYSSQMTTKVQTKSFIKRIIPRLFQHIFHFVNVQVTI